MTHVECTNCPVTTIDLKLTPDPPSAAKATAIPKAEFLLITWTQAETEAMALVFGGGLYKFKAAASTNFTPLTFPGLPIPSGSTCHAYFFETKVNGKTVVCLKSEFHPKLHTAGTTIFFEKLVGPAASRNFKYAVTSGTSGGIWTTLDVGDVVVTNSARYGLTMPTTKQKQIFTGLADVVGTNPPAGFANWYDYVNKQIIANDACVNASLITAGGRNAASPKPSIVYKAPAGSHTDVVTNERISDDECGRIATYRTLGATLDENDAYVAEAFEAVTFANWASIRNISDLPCSGNANQYDDFGLCSSINGAYALWAFVMGH
jgi:hypothetical protein